MSADPRSASTAVPTNPPKSTAATQGLGATKDPGAAKGATQGVGATQGLGATKEHGATKGLGAAKAGKPGAAGGTSSHPSGEPSRPRGRPQQSNGPSAATPLDIVRPLVRVRQMREFTSKRVTNAELEAITEVARWSGSSRNEQSCRFITLRDSDVIGKIAELGLPQTRGLRTAPLAIAIVEPDEPERGLSRAFDNGRAAERMLIAASMLGLGGGISRVRGDVRDGINELLDLPAHRSVRTIVAIGHPTDEALAPKSRPGTARLPRDQVIFDGCWPGPRAR